MTNTASIWVFLLDKSKCSTLFNPPLKIINQLESIDNKYDAMPMCYKVKEFFNLLLSLNTCLSNKKNKLNISEITLKCSVLLANLNLQIRK